jgi:two-component system, LytTR family, sensor kinase
MNWFRIGLHFTFWMVYVPLNAVLNCVLHNLSVPDFFMLYLKAEAFTLPVKMLLCYFVFYYVIPLYLDRSKIWRLVITLIGAFTIATLMYRLASRFIIFPILAPGNELVIFEPSGLMLTVFDLFITLAAAVIIKMIRVHYKSLEYEQELIREKLQSELNFLRAQTNPHFLFNTLNNLYVLARKKSDKTPEAIMRLSKIMRFVLHECRAAQISVAEEAKIIQDFIELEKLRYNDRLNVTYSEVMDNPGTPIAPLLLLPFVENSFKHGAHGTTGKVDISISLLLENQHLKFTVENTIDEKKVSETLESQINLPGGIGLNNVARQLYLLYPDRYQLNISKEDELFIATLEVDLH